MSYAWGHERRYNDFSTYIRKLFNERVQKISIHAGFTCPNRDGSKGTGGCTFCNNESFKPSYCQPAVSVSDQITKGISFFRARHPEAKFLAYFQAYTNTYGELSQLIDLYDEALTHSEVIGLIVGTRPDCLPPDVLDYFAALNKRTHVTIELGVESTSDITLNRVNRGHDFKSTRDAVTRLADMGISTGAHLILGLPGESREEMLMHASRISDLPINYLKVHQLQYVKGSQLGSAFLQNPENFRVFEVEEYVELVVDFLERVRPDIVMERFASQAPHNLLLAPKWGLKNFEFVRLVDKRLSERDTWQGKLY
ncbi:TIGR01212 family radical SAM protein [Alkaliflexus imshenetskii]|uniref:TIGR01212 family radical SAM protein n=1 Tax=Alkaliflexus imshenetskii TaxID=286730 RepID=UPI00047AAFBC|nr:TIGR01212 family radical SAM protein [Alkaliflexus imshenetskii]